MSGEALERARGVETGSAKQFTETHFLTNSQVNMFHVNCFGIRYRVSINISRRCRFLHELIVPHACVHLYIYIFRVRNFTPRLLLMKQLYSFHILKCLFISPLFCISDNWLCGLFRKRIARLRDSISTTTITLRKYPHRSSYDSELNLLSQVCVRLFFARTISDADPGILRCILEASRKQCLHGRKFGSGLLLRP